MESLIEDLQIRLDALEGGENAEETLGALEDPYDADDIRLFDDADDAEAPHGFSWSLVDFTFEWTDSLDPNTIFIDASYFRVQTQDDTVTEQFINSNGHDELFSDSFLSVGVRVEGTLVLLIPIDEPYYIPFGDDVYFDVVYIEVGARE